MCSTESEKTSDVNKLSHLKIEKGLMGAWKMYEYEDKYYVEQNFIFSVSLIDIQIRKDKNCKTI